MEDLLSVYIEQWKAEMESVGDYLDSYGDRLPAELKQEHAEVTAELKKAG
jgi:phosphoenolpyruvate carboxykinase (GTP)